MISSGLTEQSLIRNAPAPPGATDSSPVTFPRRASALRDECRVSKEKNPPRCRRPGVEIRAQQTGALFACHFLTIRGSAANLPHQGSRGAPLLRNLGWQYARCHVLGSNRKRLRGVEQSRQLLPPPCRFKDLSLPPTRRTIPSRALPSYVHRPQSLGAQARDLLRCANGNTIPVLEKYVEGAIQFTGSSRDSGCETSVRARL
jgi:hypothetical protein